MKTFTTLVNYYGSLSQADDAQNLTLGKQMINDAHRYLFQKYYDNERTYTVPGGTITGQQAYTLPFNNFQIKDVTIQVGGFLYTPPEILTRQEWDQLNFIQYQSTFPFRYFIYNNQLLIFPIPSTDGEPITINYKIRIPDLVLDDVTTGTVSVLPGDQTVIGTGTNWTITTGTNELRWLNIPLPGGDNEWYQVQSVDSTTQLTLVSPYSGITNVSGASYTLGQVPIIKEDFQDLLVYRPLMIYFSSINKDDSKEQQFYRLYKAGIERMDEFEGAKSTDVSLGTDAPILNPNLFWQI